MKDKVCKRVLTLPDIHYPDNIDLTPIEKFMVDFKPTHVVYLGDLLDLSYISKYNERNARGNEGKRLRKDYDEVRKLVKKHKKLCPKAEFVYLLGNHEARVEVAIDKDPAKEGFWEIDNKANLGGGLFDVIIPYSDIAIWAASKYLGYMHGFYYGMHHAKKTTMEFAEMSIIYGHTHDRQLHTKMNFRDVKPKPRYAQSIGCLCTLSPEYKSKKGQNNRWVHAFSVAYVWNKDLFNEYTVHIIDGKFCFNGKIYK